MKKTIKSYLYTTASLAAVFGVVASPVIASAATDTAGTTVTATVGSTISITSSGTVGFNITPVSGGAQSSSSDTITVNTNNASGYKLELSSADATNTLSNGTDTVASHAGTVSVPAALANNTWGFAVENEGAFDASYSALNSAASSASVWAGVPTNAAAVEIKTTGATATNDTTTVWYSAKVDTSKSNGDYEDTVTYTATTNN